MSVTQLRGNQLRAATLGRDRIDPAFEATLAAVESQLATVISTMSTDAERLAAIDAVITAFQAGDTDLQAAITSLVNATKVGAGLESDGSLLLGITNYLGSSASLKAAVVALDAAVKVNVDALVAADAALQGQITDLAASGAATAAADLADAVLAQGIVDAAQDAALGAEATRATGVEAGLQTQVDNEVAARTLLNTTLSNSIAANALAATAATSAEATRAAAAETVLQNSIDAEALARTNADGVHTAAIAQEVIDRGAEIAALEATHAADNTLISDRVLVLEAGVSGGLTYDKYVPRETPAGLFDGVNALFVLANTPYVGTESVFFNGFMLDEGEGNDYTIVGKDITLTLNNLPVAGDKLKVSYFR